MSWLGKIIGGLAGALMLGPIGLLFGFFIGHQFDKGLNQNFQFGTNTINAQKSFFEATFSMMGYIAKADGRVSENEIKIAESIMDSFRLNSEMRELARQYFRTGKEPNFDWRSTLQNLQQACHGYNALLQMFVDIQYQTASIDGLTPEKQRIIDIICEYLHCQPFANAHYQHYQQAKPHQTTKTDPYTVLDIKHDASDKEVKRAYRKLMSQNHPDKLVSQGLPEEMMKLATEKTQAIQAAYEAIRSEREF